MIVAGPTSRGHSAPATGLRIAVTSRGHSAPATGLRTAVTSRGHSAPATGLRTAVIACGALAADVRKVARRRGWLIDVHPVPALLHNRPERIPAAVKAEVERLSDSYDRVAVAYADCGTYGALDTALSQSGVRRLEGQHCYDLFARDEVREALDEEPGTYFLTDFLARTFEHTVMKELGLDRHPELRDDYFGHYTRVMWLAQRPTLGTKLAAERAGAAIGLPLEIREVGNSGLERALEALLARDAA
jgi:Protein of unknown function (DUF1638)